MIGLLEVAPVTFIEKLVYGGRMLLIGMGAVFIVLAALWGCLEIMHRLIARFTNKDGVQKQEKTAKEVIQPTAVVSPSATPSSDDEDEIVAAICAALAAAQADQPQLQFRAVAFRRIH